MATFYQMNTPRGHLAPQLGGGLPGDRLGRGGRGARGRRSAPSLYREAPSLSSYKCSNCPYGLSSPRLVVLSRAVRERPRVGSRPDHRLLVAVRLPGGAGGQRRWGAGAPGGVLLGVAGVPVGVVPAGVRAAALSAVRPGGVTEAGGAFGDCHDGLVGDMAVLPRGSPWRGPWEPAVCADFALGALAAGSRTSGPGLVVEHSFVY